MDKDERWCGQQWNGITMCRPAAPEARKATIKLPKVDATQGETP